MAQVKEGIVRPHEIPPRLFIETLASRLKEMSEFKMPEWALFVKTSRSKARMPEKEEWWHIRAASILRTVYVKGVIGVSKLRSKYGSKQKRGVRPEKFAKGGGKIIRTILQQATKAELIEHVKGKKAGRRLTKKGKEFLEALSTELSAK